MSRICQVGPEKPMFGLILMVFDGCLMVGWLLVGWLVGWLLVGWLLVIGYWF